MQEKPYQRLELLVKETGITKLKKSRCIVFGLGGVGSYAVETLARSFIGEITLVDFDTISITNINRQIHSNVKTIGEYKAEVLKSRIEDINPECIVNINVIKLEKENIDSFNLATYDYVIDAIDDTSAKLSLITYCLSNKIKIISSMGMANRLMPEKIKIDKIKNTSVCPIARLIRRELKKINMLNLDVVYSTEHTIKNANTAELGSANFTVSVAGILMASYVIRQILEK